MQLGYDFKTDNSDDIMLNGDIFVETDLGINTIKNAERRVAARYDDFTLLNISAGIERYIGKTINEMTKFIITEEISRALSGDGLLTNREFKVIIPDIKNIRSIPVFLKFSSPYITSDNSFRVMINIENQRSYK